MQRYERNFNFSYRKKKKNNARKDSKFYRQNPVRI